MSTRKQPKTKRLMNWLLRSLLVVGQQPRGASQGFVLPTVVMVTLVVVLLTTAMVLRSFDRSKNASNFRVNEAALNAASPGLDRARAKIDALFDDPALPRGTPSETEMYNAIATKERYTFGDEARLKVAFDINGGGISTATGPLQDQEVVTTAWRFPVDTDNNGKFDSYTLYGIYLRSPSVGSNGAFNRPRNPLEARSAPMVDDRTLDAACRNAFGGPTTSTFLSTTGWYRVNDVLKKSFFVYAATVPLNASDPIVGSNAAKYEAYKGNKGFSALELQQDRSRIPIYNAAVLYEDDLEISPGPEFRLNGRIFTNSNFLTGKTSEDIRYYQVSGTNSCYIKNEENSKIVVGGNVAYGNFTGGATGGGVRVDLYRGGNTINGVNIDSDRRSASNASTEISYNSQVYTERIDFLVRSAILRGGTPTTSGTYPNIRVTTANDPAEVNNNIASRLNSDASLDLNTVRQEEMERYFRQRTRRVPYIEAPFGSSIIGTTVGGITIADGNSDGIADANTGVFPTTGQLRPPDAWAMPTGADGVTSTGYTGLTLKGSGTTMEMPMTEPDKRKNDYNRQERLLGDRVFVGNNLPFLRYLANSDSFVGQRTRHDLVGKTWDDGPGTRYRETRIEELPDLGVTNRSGFWEKAATEQPVNALDNVGGLRVITGAGIYRNSASTLTTATGTPRLNDPSWFDDALFGTPSRLRLTNLASGEPAPLVSRDAVTNISGSETTNLGGSVGSTERYTIVWPDSAPMMGGLDASGSQITAPPDLRMRATAVYHYKHATGIDQKPIACISSYLDPTNSTTAKNKVNADGGYGIDTTNGRSNNGVVYAAYTGTRAANISTYLSELKAQAKMMFPNGRIANEQLQSALKKLNGSGAVVSGKSLTLAENAAIDTAICALQILDGTLASPNPTPTANFPIPHGTIREISFLDARQVKAIDRPRTDLTVTAGSGNATTGIRTYTLSATTGLKVGDVVTISGFANGTSGNEAELNVTRGTITGIPSTTSITVAGGSPTSASTSSVSATLIEAVTGSYDLSIEERQPLEVRATAINLGLLKAQQVGGASPNEYLLPNSGIIYASRDDALLDASASLNILSTDTAAQIEQKKATQRRNSPVDYRLDSSRRPNAILLENGSSLGRETNYRPEEKGLVLATDLPVYIKGDFNLHSQEEFTTAMTANWGNFYGRTGINDNFACRIGQYTGCTSGDPWRPATVLADAITPLSNGFSFGFRNQGDYDVNNNLGDTRSIRNRRKNGFWNNSFVTSRFFTDTEYSTNGGTGTNSSYFNNFVTPIQRRVNSPEYVMEICRKLPVSECGPGDWVVGFDRNGDGFLDANERNIRADQIGKELATAGKAAGPNNILENAEVAWDTAFGTGNKSPRARLGAGTTNLPALPLTGQTAAEAQRYARRIAFGRNPFNALVFTEVTEVAASGSIPAFKNAVAKPIGIGCPLDAIGDKPINNGCRYPDPLGTATPGETATENVHFGTQRDNTLWFRTTTTTVGKPGEVADFTYANNQPLSYSPPDPLDGATKLILPDTQCFTSSAIVPCGSAQVDGVVNLNLPTTDKASDYTLCLDANGNNGGRSKRYTVTQADFQAPLQTDCAAGTRTAIDNAVGATSVTGLQDFATNSIDTLPTVTVANGAGGVRVDSGTLRAVGPVTVYEFPNDIRAGATITLDANGQSNPVFVLKTPTGGLNFNGVGDPIALNSNCSATNFPTGSTGCGVQVKLVGVSPNDIFWVGNFRFNPAHAQRPHSLAGNFIADSGAAPNLGEYTNIDGGRFLGYTQAPNFPANTTFTAVTADGQPPVVPVLQLQVTSATSGGAVFPPTTGNNAVKDTKWLPRPDAETTYNLVAAAGDTPARPTEGNGGLHNFLRFLEMWKNVEVEAFGSFVQYKRSVFATAPFQPLLTANTGPGGLFNYPQLYKTDAGGGLLPFYEAPNRNWGFDVALLKQRRPDLLAERFSTEPILSANEFFREASRDDEWVQQLLCAKAVSDNSNAINTSERPANCPW